jgi:hypothetical protein
VANNRLGFKVASLPFGRFSSLLVRGAGLTLIMALRLA